MGGFYPKQDVRYIAQFNPKENYYEIIDSWSGTPVRANIGTRKDANN